MTASHPPRLATAFLRWMGPRDEALIGDLLEHYCAGRSNWWYWRQVLAAIVIGAVTTVRSHKLTTINAIALGWATVWLYLHYVSASVYAVARAVFGFRHFLFVTGITDWFWVHNIDLPTAIVRVGPDIVTGWIGMFASGWLVGRLHRSLGAAMVLAYFVSLPLPLAWTIVWRIVESPRYAGVPLVSVVIGLLAGYLPALIGGLWAVRPRDGHSAKGEKRDLVAG